MDPIILKSTSKTFQVGIIGGFDVFIGITIKGTDMTYDPVTGMPTGGTIRWIDYTNDQSVLDGPWSALPWGTYKLSNLTITDVTELNASGIDWTSPEGFFDLIDAQSPLSLHVQAGIDPITGTDQGDVITTGTWQARGTIDGVGGDDKITGGSGSDTLLGGDGNDVILGWSDHDSLFGGTGNDSLFGNWGNDRLTGGAGDDHLSGGAGHDTIFGDDEPYYAETDPGNDTIFGGDDDDTIFSGNLSLALTGNDRIFGGAGDDFISGGLGDDKLFGGAGDDTLMLVAGNDLGPRRRRNRYIFYPGHRPQRPQRGRWRGSLYL